MLKKFLKPKTTTPSVQSPQTESTPKPGLFGRLVSGLTKTRQGLTAGISNLFLGKKQIDQALLDEIEMLLLGADIGAAACQDLMDELHTKLARKELADSKAVLQALKELMLALLLPVEKPLLISQQQTPFVILMVGINGAGKTTTIGKLAKQLQDQGKTVMLAAGDTFRAAAIEQLQAWGERNKITVIAQHTGSDSAAVAFDALQSAKAKQVDVLIIDTAGRLHTQDRLMAELAKIKKVISKIDEAAPHEVLLVLDASIGQNAINQAEQFQQAVKVSGLCMTKLDGSAKGGIVFAIAKKLGIPIRYVGVGEQIEDLRCFNAKEFIEALFDADTEQP